MVGSRRRLALKRALDITLATCGLIALTPFMAAAAVAIRITIGEPVLFRQERPGLKGRPFTILKFRSMSSATGPDGELLPEAERLTRLGYWMRKTSFDELPELWNVLRGEMSVVGPRPLLMRYLPLYSAEQMRRHDAKPGITGLAQVRGRHTLDWAERFRLDTWYVDNWSLRLDAWVIRETLSVLLKGQARFGSGSGRVTFSWHGNDDRSDPTMPASPEDHCGASVAAPAERGSAPRSAPEGPAASSPRVAPALPVGGGLAAPSARLQLPDDSDPERGATPGVVSCCVDHLPVGMQRPSSLGRATRLGCFQLHRHGHHDDD